MSEILSGVPINFLEGIWQGLSMAWFIVFPPLFYWLFKILWMDFVQGNYWGNMQWVMLEVIPPADIEATPQPMEMIYDSILGITKG
ncbi:MAG: hypothetical protein GX765_00820, partial [Candidatus Moranbacteria bacterium]|nr:hypothetical protein [Candidatus Moranbacteria bacterium]